MHSVAASRQRRLDYLFTAQVRLGGCCRADVYGFIGQVNRDRVRVGFRIRRNRSDRHFAARTDNARRDFAPIGDQQLADHPYDAASDAGSGVGIAPSPAAGSGSAFGAASSNVITWNASAYSISLPLARSADHWRTRSDGSQSFIWLLCAFSAAILRSIVSVMLIKVMSLSLHDCT